MLRRLAGARFQVLFHSPPGVLFTFPSRYWSAIGHMGVFRLGWWSTRIRTGFLVPGPTQAPSGGPSGIRVRGSNPVPPAFPGRSAPPAVFHLHARGPATPAAPRRSPVWPRSPFARRYSGNLVVDFSSSGYLDVSVPPVAPSPAMCSPGRRRRLRRRVHPFGDPRVVGRVPLTADYRSLPRPSSAPCAKASALRP